MSLLVPGRPHTCHQEGRPSAANSRIHICCFTRHVVVVEFLRRHLTPMKLVVMQVCKLPIRQAALGSSTWSLAITSRAFSVSSACINAAQTLQTPEDAISRDAASSETPALAKTSALSKDSGFAKASKRSIKQERDSAYFRTRYASDPNWREQRLLNKAAWASAQRVSNPEWCARTKQENHKLYHTKYKEDPYFAIRHALRNWCYGSYHIRDRLSWKKHVPVMTTEKVERRCASCNVKRRNGTRLWWQRRQSSEHGQHLYDCTLCFWKDLETALPQGFEDVKTVRQLFLRRKQLLGIKAKLRKNVLSPPST